KGRRREGPPEKCGLNLADGSTVALFRFLQRKGTWAAAADPNKDSGPAFRSGNCLAWRRLVRAVQKISCKDAKALLLLCRRIGSRIVSVGPDRHSLPFFARL